MLLLSDDDLYDPTFSSWSMKKGRAYHPLQFSPCDYVWLDVHVAAAVAHVAVAVAVKVDLRALVSRRLFWGALLSTLSSWSKGVLLSVDGLCGDSRGVERVL